MFSIFAGFISVCVLGGNKCYCCNPRFLNNTETVIQN